MCSWFSRLSDLSVPASRRCLFQRRDAQKREHHRERGQRLASQRNSKKRSLGSALTPRPKLDAGRFEQALAAGPGVREEAENFRQRSAPVCGGRPSAGQSSKCRVKAALHLLARRPVLDAKARADKALAKRLEQCREPSSSAQTPPRA